MQRRTEKISSITLPGMNQQRSISTKIKEIHPQQGDLLCHGSSLPWIPPTSSQSRTEHKEVIEEKIIFKRNISAGAVRMTAQIYCHFQCSCGKVLWEFSAATLKLTANLSFSQLPRKSLPYFSKNELTFISLMEFNFFIPFVFSISAHALCSKEE